MSELRGTVARWLPERGYGFIRGDDGRDYFVYWENIVMKQPRKFLIEGGRVTFDAVETGIGRTKWGAVRVVPDRMEEK